MNSMDNFGGRDNFTQKGGNGNGSNFVEKPDNFKLISELMHDINNEGAGSEINQWYNNNNNGSGSQ